MWYIYTEDNIKEKALKLEFTKSEVGRLIKDIFGKQIKNKVEKGLADSLITEQFTATMTVLEQKWKNIEEKGETFYQYVKDNKLYQIKGCMSAEVRAIVGFGVPRKPYLQNADVCMNNVLNPAGSKKCKRISEVVEKLWIAVKKQENQVILSLLNQGEWALLDTYKKYVTGGMYYQMSMKQRELTVADVTNSHIPSPNLSISVVFCTPLLKFLMKFLILPVIFSKIQCLLISV